MPRRLAYVFPEPAGGPLVVYLMHVPDGTPVVLRDSAALIWGVAADGEPDVVDAVAQLVGRPADEIAPDTRNYLADLVARGLLEEDT